MTAQEEELAILCGRVIAVRDLLAATLQDYQGPRHPDIMADLGPVRRALWEARYSTAVALDALSEHIRPA